MPPKESIQSYPVLNEGYIGSWLVNDNNISQRLQEIVYRTNNLVNCPSQDVIQNSHSYSLNFRLISRGMYRAVTPLLEHRKQILNTIIMCNYIPFFKRCYGEIIKEFEAKRVRYDSSLTNAQLWEKYQTEEKHIHEAANNFYQGVVIFWCGTDIRDKDMQRLMYNELGNFYVELLESKYLYPLKEEDGTPPCMIVKGLLGTLHNFCHSFNSCVIELKEANALATVSRFREYKSTAMLVLRAKATLVSSYLLSENDKSSIEMNEGDIGFLLRCLKSALSGKNYHSDTYGYHSDELMAGINNVAVLDTNKQKLVETNPCVLSLYTAALKSNNFSMQLKAIQGLWTLAFDEKCKKRIIEEPDCLQYVKVLSFSGNTNLNPEENENLKIEAKRAMWQIEGDTNREIKTVSTESAKQQHIMISYQWDVKPEVLKLKDRLCSEGYKVWIDVEQMCGSSIDSMVSAVENAAVIIPALTDKYKASTACRQELEYATSQKKLVMPIRLQPKYLPDGWLGFLLGSTFFYDLTKPEEYEKKVRDLINAVGTLGKATIGGVQASGERVDSRPALMPTIKVEPNLPMDGHRVNCSNWNTEEVAKWLKSNKLEKLNNVFTEVDGPLLSELVHMFGSSPDYYYNMLLKEDSTIKMIDMLRLNSALRKLT